MLIRHALVFTTQSQAQVLNLVSRLQVGRIEDDTERAVKALVPFVRCVRYICVRRRTLMRRKHRVSTVSFIVLRAFSRYPFLVELTLNSLDEAVLLIQPPQMVHGQSLFVTVNLMKRMMVLAPERKSVACN